MADGVLLIDTVASGKSEIGYTKLEDMSHVDLGSAQGVVSVASTPGRDTVGWIDQKGNATISRNGKAHQLRLGGLQAEKIVAFVQRSEFLVLARGSDSKGLIFNAQTQDPEIQFDADQLAASPLGDRILVVRGNAVQVYDRGTKTTRALNISEIVHEPSWRNEEVVSFWRENSGQPEIDQLNVENGQLTPITTLDPSLAPTTIEEGMICPVWNNDELYFADNRDGKNQILRASEQDGTWGVSTFAETNDSRFGLICPSVSNAD